jgi:hypothetical protein
MHPLTLFVESESSATSSSVLERSPIDMPGGRIADGQESMTKAPWSSSRSALSSGQGTRRLTQQDPQPSPSSSRTPLRSSRFPPTSIPMHHPSTSPHHIRATQKASRPSPEAQTQETQTIHQVQLPSNPAPPVQVLTTEANMEAWHRSPGFRGFMGWLKRRCEKIKGERTRSGEYEGNSEVGVER